MSGREVQTRTEKHTIRRGGVAVSRKLHVLRPTKFWKLKHPTDTELLNVTRKERQKNFTLQPCDGQSTFFSFLFFLNLIKTSTEAVYSQAARTQCVQYIAKKQTVSSELLTMLLPFFTVLWHSVGVLYLFTKNAFSCKELQKYILCGADWLRYKKRNVRPSSDATQSSSSECQSTFRITTFRG